MSQENTYIKEFLNCRPKIHPYLLYSTRSSAELLAYHKVFLRQYIVN